MSVKPVSAVNVNDMSAEQLRTLAKRKQAEEDARELETNGLRQFKQNIAMASSLDQAYKTAKAFTWKREQVRKVLNPGTGKKGRPTTE